MEQHPREAVTLLVKKVPYLMEPHDALPCSQLSATESYCEPGDSTSTLLFH
jgi:hypothetical protein